jgi:tRNA pseudouridine13 synthase
VKPTRPVPRGCRAGFFAGRYKVRPEDFVVEEVPAYEPSGDGSHVWLWVEKRGLSTIDLVHALGERLDRDERAFGVAGLKDARSVSRQWLSLDAGGRHALDPARLEGLEGDGFRVLRVSRHHNKLRLGHLHGNRFVVLLRGTAAGDVAIAEQNLAELVERGVPNYFGEQRFGKRGANLQKGLDALRGNARAVAFRMPRRVFGLCISAVQSEVFNRVVIERLETLGTLLPGDLAQLHKNGAVFPVEDPTKEQPRADALELSPSGPLPGPEMPQPAGEVQALERRALEAVGLTGDEFRGLPFQLGRGLRRPLRMPVKDAAARAVDGGLELAFTLPAGGYATAVLRELLTDTIWFCGD